MRHKTKTENESSLACRGRSGNIDAVEKLLSNNWGWLKGLVYNILGDSDEADDTMQEICVLVLKNIKSLRQPERFKPWLATVARNAALAARQKRSKRPLQLDEQLAGRQLNDQTDLAFETVARGEQHELVLDAIRQLPEKYREVFILKHLKEMTYGQIAEILEINLTTVQIRLVRARRMIYNRLTGRPNDKVPRT